MNSYLEFAKQLAKDAGEIMLKYFNSEASSRYKADNTIVTQADEEINQLVIDRVRGKYSRHGVYGEEDSFNKELDELWVCDPLDGTASFARGVPTAVFSIAYVVNGKPKLGVVYDPFTDCLYWATEGNGAFCNDKKLAVNKYGLRDKESAIGYDYSPTMPFDTLSVAYRLAKDCRVGGTGSFVHNGLLVANGGYSAAIMSGNRPYDIAAIKIIIEEAGGKVTDLAGNDQPYNREIYGAIVSNGKVHDDIVAAFKETVMSAGQYHI